MRGHTPLLLYLLACWPSQSQQPPKLIEGAAIKVAGTLKLERSGNNAYLMIRPKEPYEAVFDSNDVRRVREIGISIDGQWHSLRRLVGQQVSVSGVVQLEPVSPYYFNGTLILAKLIRLTNGSVLTSKPETSKRLPESLTRFHSQVTFSPRAPRRFSYKTWDSDAHLVSVSDEYLHCGLNGPGDVMNCSCPDGFVLTGEGKIRDGLFLELKPPEDGFSFAQFGIADPVQRSVSEAVECTRKPHP